MRKIRKEYRPVPVPEQYKALVKKLMESRGERGQQMLAKMYWPPSLSPFRYFFADDQGRLYVMTPEKEGERTYIYDIFTKDGAFIGRMRLGQCSNQLLPRPEI